MTTRKTLRLVSIATLSGFAAGAFVLSILVWHFGNFIGSQSARQRYGVERAAAIERFTQGVDSDDAGTAVLQPSVEVAKPLHPPEPPAATSGRTDASEVPPKERATIGANPIDELRDRRLVVPVEGIERSALVRSYDQERGGSRRHEAIDILAPRNTPVLAVEEGTVARLFNSRYGGLTIYQFDPEQRYIYYYAHLERYAPGLKEGDTVRRGQIIGYVGTSGNAPPNTPHLHFALFRAQAPPRWWEGVPLDPYDVLR